MGRGPGRGVPEVFRAGTPEPERGCVQGDRAPAAAFSKVPSHCGWSSTQPRSGRRIHGKPPRPTAAHWDHEPANRSERGQPCPRVSRSRFPDCTPSALRSPAPVHRPVVRSPFPLHSLSQRFSFFSLLCSFESLLFKICASVVQFPCFRVSACAPFVPSCGQDFRSPLSVLRSLPSSIFRSRVYPPASAIIRPYKLRKPFQKAKAEAPQPGFF